MIETTGLLGVIYNACRWIMNLAVVNLLWLFFNLPVGVILIAGGYGLVHSLTITPLIVPLVIIVPIFFFPATTALFASARNWVIKERPDSLIKCYWRYYKENYKRSVCVGLIMTFMWAIWSIDCYFLGHENRVIVGLFIILGLLYFIYSVNLFSMMVHYNLKLVLLLKATLLITIGRPVLTLLIFAGHLIVLYLGFHFPFLIVLFFSGSSLAFASFFAYTKFAV